jgi:hypothetical protein
MEIKNLKLVGRASPPPNKLLNSAIDVVNESNLSFSLVNDRKKSQSSVSPRDKV